MERRLWGVAPHPEVLDAPTIGLNITFLVCSLAILVHSVILHGRKYKTVRVFTEVSSAAVFSATLVTLIRKHPRGA
jgi:hypothetical protein